MKIKRKSSIRLSEIFNLSMIIGIYIMLKPIYLKSSGKLQIADFFLLLGVAWVVLKYKGMVRWPRIANRVILSVVMFTVFVAAVNLAWNIIDRSSYKYSRYSLFYIFNTIAFIACIVICRSTGLERFKSSVLNGALAAGIVALVGIIIGGGGKRAVGFFNNPNQLGYFGTVIVSFAFICKGRRYGFKELAAMAAGFVCIVASLSKAAFISLAVQLFLCSVLLEKKLTKFTIIKRTVLIAGIFVLLYLFFFTKVEMFPKFEWLQRMRLRVSNMMYESDTDLGVGRGYDRIFELGINFLWGMGEGNFSRFAVKTGAEVHSTYASVIVSYGAIGMALYLFFLKNVLYKRGSLMKNLALASSILLYSVSHNGIRNTLVWIFFALMFMENERDRAFFGTEEYGMGRELWTAR